jgi:hypothetical protein
MSYDLIIVSQSIGDLIQVTQNCIDSARRDKTDLNIIIIETAQLWNYKDVNEIIKYEGQFNYNRALNLGLKSAKNEIQILANNDIIFYDGWSSIGDVMKVNNYLSACAISNDIRQHAFKRGSIAYEGYKIGYELCGWCIFTDKELWKHIGQLDERHAFWYSDNVYADQLKKKGIKHALICSIEVDHIGSRTLIKQPRQLQKQYTYSGGTAIRTKNI